MKMKSMNLPSCVGRIVVHYDTTDVEDTCEEFEDHPEDPDPEAWPLILDEVEVKPLFNRVFIDIVLYAYPRKKKEKQLVLGN
jgi:hypothetical protein